MTDKEIVEVLTLIKRIADATTDNLKTLYARIEALEAEVKQLKGESK